MPTLSPFDGSDDYTVTTHSSFYLARGTYDINEKMDVAAEFRTLMQVEANDMLYGYSAEVGYVVIKNLRLAAGYNFKGYVERDLVDNNLWSAGPFLKFSFKFGNKGVEFLVLGASFVVGKEEPRTAN
jgi:hypothetical protein